MIDLGQSLLPFYDSKNEIGGYKLAAIYDPTKDVHDIIGPTNRNYWHQSSLFHNLMLQRDLLDWLETQQGPGRTSESRRIICWDCTAFVSLLLQPMLMKGYKQTILWTPKKKEFFILDDGETIHTMVFRSAKTGTEIRIISIKAFVRGHNGLADIVAKTYPDRTPLGDIPVEAWDEPGQGGLRQIFDHSKVLTELWCRCFTSGYIYESSGRAISAGGIAWSNFCREMWARTREKPWQVLFPGMGPELVRRCRDELEDELRQGSRGQISYAKPGSYEHVYGYDLNSAYGAALDDWIPYGELMEAPDDGPCRGIVYPQGYFMIKSGRIPILSWSNSHDQTRYAWEHTYKPNSKVMDFFLDGTMPFYQEEWELLLEFYEPVGAYCIPKVWYISIMRWGLLGDRMKRLYKMECDFPEDKLFNKMQIVALYGKLSQHQETDNILYMMDADGHMKRIAVTVPMSSQHLGLGMWVTCWCRCRIMRQLLRLFDAGISPDRILYIDTDSIYLDLQCDKLFEIDPLIPGMWKYEAKNAEMIIVAAKNYQIRKSDGKIKTTSSSLPAEIKRSMKWGDLEPERSYDHFMYARDPKTWIKAPKPHVFSVAATYLETDDQAYVMPEAVIDANGGYES